MTTDVLIVGAGPVGLFTAIEMKLHNQNLNIQIVERNKEYSRSHVLRLQRKSLENSLAYQNYEEIRALEGFVPTQDIESTLLKIGTDLGIRIKRGEKVTDMNQLIAEYPDAHTVIGADGAHSTVREQLFDNKKKVDETLQYIVEIKYKATGKAESLRPVHYALGLTQVPHLVSENVGKEKEEKTPVSLFVFVGQKVYDEIRKVQNRKLEDLKPSSTEMCDLIDTIQPWLALRREQLHEQMDLESVKINGVRLDIYHVDTFVRTSHDKTIALVGDAATAYPFFRALNAGLISAQVTAKELATNAQNCDLVSLNKQLTDLAEQEIDLAKSKNSKVNKGRVINRVISHTSKLTGGSALDEDVEYSMLNARVNKPNIFRRNPRTLIAILITLPIAAVISPFLLPLFATGVALLLSFVASVTIVVALSVAFKLVNTVRKVISDWLNPPPTLQAFPWERDEDLDDRSSLSLSKLGSPVSKQASEQAPVANCDSPVAPRAAEAVVANADNVADADNVVNANTL